MLELERSAGSGRARTGGPGRKDRETLARLKRLVADELDVNLRFDEIDTRAPILGAGLAFDSIVLMELIGLIESDFGFQFPDEDLVVESFADLETLASLVDRCTATQRAANPRARTA